VSKHIFLYSHSSLQSLFFPGVCLNDIFFDQVPISVRHLESREMVVSKFKVVNIRSWVLPVFWRYCSQSSLTSSSSHFTEATSVCGRAAGLNSHESGSWGGVYLFSSLDTLESKMGMRKLFLLNLVYLLNLWAQAKT